jgi:IS1 family transposase
MPKNSTTNSWLFPPRTDEVQFDEKWSFVYKKQEHRDPSDPADDQHGDWWDHMALDAEHKLVLCVVPGARDAENVEALVAAAVKQRSTVRLLTSDDYPAYKVAIQHVSGAEVTQTPSGQPSRRMVPEKVPPPELTYATVERRRRMGRVVEILVYLILGTFAALARALRLSKVSRRVNVSFLERYNATDRHKNARKVRKTYTFSKDWRVHESMTYFTIYIYNFCWPVRTLEYRDEEGRIRARSPAMAAGLADHVWTMREWITMPSVQCA